MNFGIKSLNVFMNKSLFTKDFSPKLQLNVQLANTGLLQDF